VTIYDGGIAIGTAVVASNGTWTFTPSVDLNESTHQITVRATDAAGNTGPASPVFTLTVDLTPPDAPTAIVLTDDTGLIEEPSRRARLPMLRSRSWREPASPVEPSPFTITAW
jgi:hypothetical protein